MSEFNHRLLAFIDASPTPFHAVEQMSSRLLSEGFEKLELKNGWQLQPGGYFVTQNDSSLVAFSVGTGDCAEAGFRMVGAHTDSPCLKLKPNPSVSRSGCKQLAAEVYGGALLNPWFDRDLGLAGRVTYSTLDGRVASTLVNFDKAIAVIPSLAIHLDREANRTRSINPQTDIVPVVGLGKDLDIRQLLMARLAEQGVDSASVLDFELSFYDCQGGSLVGLQQELICASRLDNLLSCFTGMEALLASDPTQFSALVCNDHEEVGSVSASGAQGPLLREVLKRVAGNSESFSRAMSQSRLISTDNAHAVHPNFADRHDKNHAPKLNAGPVIKTNTNQRYATDSESAAEFRMLCAKESVPVQDFTVRTDLACGSTIGPLIATELGVKTIDVGLPTWGMHSIRETAGSEDAANLVKVLVRFYSRD